MPTPPPPTLVSVVVPTRDRPDALARCLAAIARQHHAPLETIVVDDGSTDGDRVAAAVAATPARLIRTPGTGPAAARNAGARAATGDLVCFTDDDCAPAPDWVERLVAATLGTGSQCAAGRTLAPRTAGPAVRASQAMTNHLQRTAGAPDSPSAGFAPTSNLACTRRLALALPFDESFDRAAGEDRDWAARAAARGAAPAFAHDAVVTHHARLGTRAFARQQLRYGRAASRFRAGASGAGDRRRVGSPRFYAGLVQAGFREGPAAGALVCAAQVLIAAGAGAERTSALKQRLAGEPVVAHAAERGDGRG